MNVLIRADASAQTGGGHVARCIALAGAINARGGQTVFATRQDAGPGHRMLEAAGMPYVQIPASDDWQDDANATRRFADDKDWIVVDHYGLDARWQAAVARDRADILVIDDLADRPHACAILADSGRPGSRRSNYDSLVPADCAVLLGPRFAMLRPGFGTVRAERPERARPNLLVFFGSADGRNLTAHALDALESLNLRDALSVHVVLTAANRHADSIRKRDGICVHENVADMASLVADMDIALGAGGVSMWERCSVGVPGLTIGLNENQMPGLRLAEAAGAIRALALADALQPEIFADAIRQFVTSPRDWGEMAASGRGLVDGRGAERVAAQMGPLDLRAAGPADCDLLWQWANDPGVRAMAFNSAPIPLEDHRAWFAARMESRNSLIAIAEQAGAPVGQVRFDTAESDADAGGWEIDISMATEYRGRNLALEVLQKALVLFCRIHSDAVPIAWVKTGNVPSARLFEAAGFQRDGGRPGASRFSYR